MNFKPLSERLHQRAFGGAVMGVDSAFPAIDTSLAPHLIQQKSPDKAPAQSLLSIVLAKIASAQPVFPELQAEKMHLLASTVFDLPAVDAFLEACAEERQANLEKRHVELRSACRQQAQKVQQAEARLQSAELALMNIAAEAEAANSELNALHFIELRGQNVPRWATDEERKVWTQKVAEVKARVTKINAEAAVATQTRNQAFQRLQPEIEAMNKLGHEELRVRKELANESYIDPEFGLACPPEGGLRQ